MAMTEINVNRRRASIDSHTPASTFHILAPHFIKLVGRGESYIRIKVIDVFQVQDWSSRQNMHLKVMLGQDHCQSIFMSVSLTQKYWFFCIVTSPSPSCVAGMFTSQSAMPDGTLEELLSQPRTTFFSLPSLLPSFLPSFLPLPSAFLSLGGHLN